MLQVGSGFVEKSTGISGSGGPKITGSDRIRIPVPAFKRYVLVDNAGQEASHRGGNPGTPGGPSGEHQGLQPQAAQILGYVHCAAVACSCYYLLYFATSPKFLDLCVRL